MLNVMNMDDNKSNYIKINTIKNLGQLFLAYQLDVIFLD